MVKRVALPESRVIRLTDDFAIAEDDDYEDNNPVIIGWVISSRDDGIYGTFATPEAATEFHQRMRWHDDFTVEGLRSVITAPMKREEKKRGRR